MKEDDHPDAAHANPNAHGVVSTTATAAGGGGEDEDRLTPAEFVVWARSLCGRDWEIYWNDEDDAPAAEEATSQDDDDGDDHDDNHNGEEELTERPKVLNKDDFMEDPLQDDDPDGPESGAKVEQQQQQPDDDEWEPDQAAAAASTAASVNEAKAPGDPENEKDSDMVVEGVSADTTTTVAATATTATGQETSEGDNRTLTMVTRATTKTDKMEVDEEVNSDDKEDTEDQKDDTDVPMEEGGDDDESDGEGSIINDWYDGRVVGLDEPQSLSQSSTTSPKGKSCKRGPPSSPTAEDVAKLTFKVLFVGDDDIYNIRLVPSKVRPSARGWVKRTVALLAPDPPPSVAASEEGGEQSIVWDVSDLPLDTRTPQDEDELQRIEERFLGVSHRQQPDSRSKNRQYWGDSLAHETIAVACNLVLPTLADLERIRDLRNFLHAQLYLRSKLSKIENPSEEGKFTEGVRNPTEPYVKHLIQCCMDVDQACDWYVKSWKLVGHLLGDGRAGEKGQAEALDQLTFDDLLRDYLEFGKVAILNAAAVDVNTAISNKRRQPAAATGVAAASRRTKRRRKRDSWAGAESLKTDIRSTEYVDFFVQSVTEDNATWYIIALGNMLRAVSHLVVKPLVVWKTQAGLILCENDSDFAQVALEKMKPLPIKVSNASKRVGGDETSKGSNDAEMPDTINGGNVEASGSHDESSDDEEADQTFSYEEIQAFVSAIRNDRVLSRFNLFNDVHKLHAKLHEIEKAESAAQQLLQRLAEDSQSPNKSDDAILKGLTAIKEAWMSAKSAIRNVDRLGKESGSPIGQDDLTTAIEVREWLLDVKHADCVRERESFLLRRLSKVSRDKLQNVNNLPPVARNADTELRLRDANRLVDEMLTKFRGFEPAVEEFGKVLENPILERSDIMSTIDNWRTVLEKVDESPVISLVQEKIAARIDILLWYSRVNETLPDFASASLTFDEIATLNESLQIMLRGNGVTRSRLIQEVVPNDKVDNEIRALVAHDVDQLCGVEAKEVTKLYQLALSWKERSESILSCLRLHGNKCVSTGTASQKPPNMVDIKRIDDLLKEYSESRVIIPGYVDVLQKVKTAANDWSSTLEKVVLGGSLSFEECLNFLEMKRDSRPTGLMMDPSRSVVDYLVDLLSWYKRVKESMSALLEKSRHPTGIDPTEISSFLAGKAYPLLADGMDALEMYCERQQLKPNSITSMEILDKVYNLRKTSKVVSAERLNSNPLTSSVFSAMASQDGANGFPLQMLLWFQWHLTVANFVAPWDETDRERLPRERVPSLADARELTFQQPFVVVGSIDLNERLDARAIVDLKSSELLLFNKIIDDAEKCESGVKHLLAKRKEMLRGSIAKADIVRLHLVQLKDCLAAVKFRATGKDGVSLNPTLEIQLDQHIKIFGWLIRTFPYPVLHLDEVSFSALVVDTTTEDSNRIPWEALIVLFDRIPNDVEESGDFALCALRVRELYHAGEKWQSEVTRLTMISNRGSKRRTTKSTTDAEKSEHDETENAEKLQKDKMEFLAQDTVLAKVAMPREKAVTTMINNSREFEVQLRKFLAQDYDGTSQDKMLYPNGHSLVGRDGQFILFRLTGSPLFAMMQSSMYSLSQIGSNVFAETPGKAAFDWMSSAVAWIERLHDAVSTETPFLNTKGNLLVIPTKEANELCAEGEEIFLQTPEDMRQTLSSHGIFVSTSAQRKSLKVTLKKDGAHHSVGGTVIRWCPILFDALRADVAKLDAWECSLTKILWDFNAFNAETRDDPNDDERNLYRWYCFREKVRVAIDEGQQSLVIAPTSTTVNSAMNSLNSMKTWLEQNSCPELNVRFAKEFYAESPSIYMDRFILLDSLLHRRALSEGTDDKKIAPEFADLKQESNFRANFRSGLESAFSKASAVLCLSAFSDVGSLHSLKAVEIENELYERFQDDLAEYRNKARSLKSNLANANNMEFCLKVLVGDIGASELVKMTPAQMASQKAKLERERAQQAALKEVVLTPGVKNDNKDEVQFQKPVAKKHVPPSHSMKPSSSILKSSSITSSTSVPVKSDESGGKGGTPRGMLSSMQEQSTNSDDDDDDDADGAPTLDEDDLPLASHSSSVSSLSSTGKLLTAAAAATARRSSTAKAPPPPPPPSLASTPSFRASSPQQYDSDDGSIGGGRSNNQDGFRRNHRVETLNGKEKFRIEIRGKAAKYVFQAALYLEDANQGAINRFLPDSLTQKGRIKEEAFSTFLTEKAAGGKWNLFVMRMATINEKDTIMYRKFYKEFEQIERISMFELDDPTSSKVFLVTPKYHNVAERTGLVSFSKRDSTYAIILTKEALIWEE